jgi:hypothetical protein
MHHVTTLQSAALRFFITTPIHSDGISHSLALSHAFIHLPLYAGMSDRSCKHLDIRKFDGIRCCLACGEAVFEAQYLHSKLFTEPTTVTTAYKYNKLNYKLGREIRLAVILPGESTDTIRCEIVHVNLDDKPVYDAVSYTWATEDGDASLSRNVQTVQGGSISITANCDAVLRQLRRPGLCRRVWIDAMCT